MTIYNRVRSPFWRALLRSPSPAGIAGTARSSGERRSGVVGDIDLFSPPGINETLTPLPYIARATPLQTTVRNFINQEK
eukprot:scaffold1325_cov138-Amphora_coffeaeformis.AAC.2